MLRSPFLLSLLVLFISQVTHAQDCGTKSPSPAIYEYTRDVVSTFSVSSSLNGGTTCIPLQAHVVRASDGSGGISLLDLNIGLSYLNHLFLDAGIEFFWKGLPNYVDNDDYFEYDQQAPDNDTESGLAGLFTTATNATNIYFVNNITTSSGFVAAGYAYFPFNSAQSNRVVMRHGSTASTLNGTFVHEFGHYFNLFHTHEGTEFGNTDPNAENVPRVGASANCGTDGDLLCDTEADPRYDSGAFDFGTCMDTGGETDVNGVPYVPPVDNIMSYYPDQCGGIFTADQYTRIAQGLVVRQGHTAYSLTAAPMSVAAPTGLNVVLAGNALDLSWNDIAANEMGYVVERSTTSGTAGFRAVPGAATGPGGNAWSDMDVSSNTTYWYRVKATNGDCNAYSNVASFTTGLFYCTPGYSSPCDAGVAELGVGSFSLTGATSSITNNNSGCSSEGYMDYTGMSAAVVAGNSYNFSASAIDIGGGSYYSTLLQIWVDLNQNGSFLDAGEQMLASEATLAFTFNGSLTIPSTALNGTTRMRVRAWDPFNPCVATPCNQCAFGETEDYSLVISGGVDPFIELTAKVLLEGPFNGASMDDDLRVAGLIPASEPYGAIFGHVGDGGGETVSPAVLSGSGANAIVDWVYVELRDKNDNSSILNTRSALLQADGDVVDTDGISPVSFTSSADDYFVVIRHRNHLGTMSASPINFSPGATVDFTSSAGSSYGSNAKKNISGTFVLWLGNALVDDELKYIGSSNDRDAILVKIGGSVPTSTVSGYFTEDCNMDGTVKYIGTDNDRDPILINLGGSVPTNTRSEQLP
jgi:hypothetical protein